MSNSERPSHRLTIEMPEPGLSALIIDAEGNVVGRCTDDQQQIEIDLPRGLYTVRTARGGNFNETIVRLNSPQSVRAALPPMFSAATIPNAETTHEYYTYPAWETSQQPTAPELSWKGPADARLLLFVRAPRYEMYRGDDQLELLSLRTLEGETLSTFETGVKRDYMGWSAYSVHLSHGLLILEDRGPLLRQTPVPLFPNWQTQLFLIHNKRLLWEDMRLSTVPGSEVDTRGGRSPYDHHAEDVRLAMDMDIGLLALQNNNPSVAPQLIDAFLHAKFHNPILGLLGAYLMLLQYRRAEQTDTNNANAHRFRTVLNNLQNLLPESADVAALQVMAKPWIDNCDPVPVAGVPLFRCGAEALLQAAASNPSLLPEGSLLDAVSDNLYGDTVWTTWMPVKLPLDMSIETASGGGALDEPNWVEMAVVDAVSIAERRDEDLTVDDLVRQIGVSLRAVRDAMDRLMIRAVTHMAIPDTDPQNLRLLGGKVARKLARDLGSQFDSNKWSEFIAQSFTSIATNPSMPVIYSTLKNAIARVTKVERKRLFADSTLSDLLGADDTEGKRLILHHMQRRFHDINLRLRMTEIDGAATVRDLAQRIKSRLES